MLKAVKESGTLVVEIVGKLPAPPVDRFLYSLKAFACIYSLAISQLAIFNEASIYSSMLILIHFPSTIFAKMSSFPISL